MATIKIWGKELVCNCCSQSDWDHSRIRVTICDIVRKKKSQYNQDIYLVVQLVVWR